MGNVSGGELLVRTLAKAGVEKVFGLHGAHLEAIFQSCLDHRIPIIDVRHEAAGGHAAEGYARAANRLGVALATAGPGFTNMLSSVASAYLDRTPVLYLAGSAGLRDAETNTLQAGIDQVAMATPITRWAHRVTVAADIPRLVAHAIRLATSGPGGPVLLDLPADVLSSTVDDATVRIPETILLDAAPAPSQALVCDALELLAAAERPVIMAGVGAWRSDAAAELRRFVDATGIPVYSDFAAHGLLPSSHPAYGGTFHKMDDLAAEGQRPDVVLALGVRFGLFTLGGSDRLAPLAAKLIHVEIDPKEIGRLRDVAVAIVADPRATLGAFNAALNAWSWRDHGPWRRTVQTARDKRRRRLAPALERTTKPIHPLQAAAAIVAAIDADTLVIDDGAEAYHWLNEVIRQERPGSYLTHGFLGVVGFGLGLAIGAQVAHPERPVLCLAGDGAVGFTIAEFDTLARHRLPVVVVVMNNRSWGASQHFQEIVSGANRLVGSELSDAKYHDVARAFGCRGEVVTDVAALEPAIRAAFASGQPTCINVEIDVKPIPPEVEMLMSRH